MKNKVPTAINIIAINSMSVLTEINSFNHSSGTKRLQRSAHLFLIVGPAIKEQIKNPSVIIKVMQLNKRIKNLTQTRVFFINQLAQIQTLWTEVNMLKNDIKCNNIDRSIFGLDI